MDRFNSIYIDADRQVSAGEVASYRKQHLNLNEQIMKDLSVPGREAITDGLFDYEGYLRARVKILWLMKEPYDTGGGGWHISALYDKEFGPDRTTWYPIIDVSHAILSGEHDTKGARMKKGNAGLKQVLQHIAYMNVQKLPSKTREKSSNAVIHEAFRDPVQRGFFERQFALLDPDIVIGANTLWMMFGHFGLKGEGLVSKPTDNSYIVGRKLFINTKHPANRGSREQYITDILKAVKGWEAFVNTPSLV